MYPMEETGGGGLILSITWFMSASPQSTISTTFMGACMTASVRTKHVVFICQITVS